MRAPLYSDRPTALFEADVLEEPDSLFESLRRDRPISRVDETGVHLVATWDLIDDVLRREGDFSANLTGVLIREEAGRPGVFALPDTGANHVIATADEPGHAVHRSLAQPSLSARRIAALEARIHDWAKAALRPWLEAGGGDFAPISEIVPARAVAFLLGLPEGDVIRHRTWAMMGGEILAGDVSAERLVRLATETGRMADYLGEHLDAAGSEAVAAPSLLADLAEGVRLGVIDRVQAIGIGIVMFGAGGESTAALIGSAVRRLAEDPQTAARLRDEPALISRFVEEVARLEPPFKFHYRVVRRACELGGASLVAGDRLMLLWASANRDADHFEDPTALRLDRRHPKRHMSFGRGSHFCVGAPLARMEARVVLEQLLAGTRSIRMRAGDAPVHARSIFVRRLERLPLEIEGVGA